MYSAVRSVLLVAAAGALLLSGGARGEEDNYLTQNLIPDGDFEQGVGPGAPAGQDGYPVGWPRVANAELKVEGGNHYLSVKPGGGPTFEIPLSPDWVWVRVSFRMRCQGVKVGAEGWQDARMVMSWNDAQHQHM